METKEQIISKYIDEVHRIGSIYSEGTSEQVAKERFYYLKCISETVIEQLLRAEVIDLYKFELEQIKKAYQITLDDGRDKVVYYFKNNAYDMTITDFLLSAIFSEKKNFLNSHEDKLFMIYRTIKYFLINLDKEIEGDDYD